MDGGACGVAPPIASRLTTFIARARGEFGREYQWMPRMPCENNALPLSACQSFSSEMIDPRLERLANLVTEAGFRRRDLRARDELAVEPGSTNRCDLSFDREVRPGCEGEPPLNTDVDSPDLDDSTDGWRELQGLSVAKTNMERAPVNCVDHRVGFTSGFIVAGLLR